MKIAFVSTNEGVPWGGSEELWYQTAKILKAAGVEVRASVAFWHPRPLHIQELMDAGVTLDLRINPIGRKTYLLSRSINKLKRIALNISSPPELKFLQIFKPDLLVISQGNLSQGILWKQLCIQHSITYVSVVQLVSEVDWFNDETADQLLEVYNKAKCNYFVSQKNISLAECQLGQILNNAKVVRNPYKVPYQKKLTYPSSAPYFKLACVASLTSIHKGQELLFEVLKQEKWKSRPLKLSLYGKGPNERVLRRLKDIWELNMVEFKGFTTDVTSIWQENHGLLMGSRMEGLPLALVEAMLCQRVAIVPDVGGNAEVIQDNVTGFIARSASFYDLDEAMERAWIRRNEWQMIGELAFKAIKQTILQDPVKVFAEELTSLLR